MRQPAISRAGAGDNWVGSIVVTTHPQVLTFAEFRLDPERGELLRGDTPIALTPKAFALLEYLAARAGRLVSKQELLDAVWPNVFVGEAVLKGTIRDVRRALGDDPQTPRFIQTAHRRGYRFVATVVAADGVEHAAAAAVSAPATARTPAALRVSYARSGSVNIAYQVVGSGSDRPDLRHGVGVAPRVLLE